jgi:hypothetical protein
LASPIEQAHIQQNHVTGAQSRPQFISRKALEFMATLAVSLEGPVYLGQLLFGHGP